MAVITNPTRMSRRHFSAAFQRILRTAGRAAVPTHVIIAADLPAAAQRAAVRGDSWRRRRLFAPFRAHSRIFVALTLISGPAILFRWPDC